MAFYKVFTEKGVADPSQQAITDLKTDLAETDAKLLIHLHGGLVDEASGVSTADRLAGVRPDGFELGADWTQLYVVWRTGAFETLRQEWESIVKDDRLYQAILRRLLIFVARKLVLPVDGTRGDHAAAAPDEAELLQRITGKLDPSVPFTTFDGALGTDAEPGRRATILGPQDEGDLALEFQAELNSDLLFQDAAGDIDAVVNARADGRVALSPGDAERGERSFARLDAAVKAELMADAPDGVGRRGPVSVAGFLLKHGALIAYRCFKRFRSKRDHGLHATVVEELCRELYGDRIGAKVWGLMVQHAGDHFGPSGFGATLVSEIAKSSPGRIVVTAHSAGSIWASHLLLALKAAGVTTPVELYLLAPAVRHTLFADAVTTAGDLVGRCRMLTMSDELERRDALLGHDRTYIYPSSLLYLVSGLFETTTGAPYADAPILGMARFTSPSWLDASEALDAQRIAAFFQQPDKGVLYATVAGVTMADSHGAFDSEHDTLATVRSMFVE